MNGLAFHFALFLRQTRQQCRNCVSEIGTLADFNFGNGPSSTHRDQGIGIGE